MSTFTFTGTLMEATPSGPLTQRDTIVSGSVLLDNARYLAYATHHKGPMQDLTTTPVGTIVRLHGQTIAVDGTHDREGPFVEGDEPPLDAIAFFLVNKVEIIAAQASAQATT